MNSLPDDPLLSLLQQTVAAHGLIQPGDRVLVAVSGGPDSLALLHALIACKKLLALTDLQAAHLDHGLRGEESASEASFVEQWCRQRLVPCWSARIDTQALMQAQHRGAQETARAARYTFLEETAKNIDANKVATGHTQDDQVETVLLNILRGTGIRGLGGIPYQRGCFIRPLLDTPRALVDEYCTGQGLSPSQDSSNQDLSHYLRNRVRLELLPLLERGYNQGTKAAILRLSETARRDTEVLESLGKTALQDVLVRQTEASMTLSADGIRQLLPGLQRHVVRAAFLHLRQTLQGISHAHIEYICAALAGDHRLPFGLTTPTPLCSVRVTLRKLTLKKLQ